MYNYQLLNDDLVKSINFTIKAHDGQYRKGSSIPYAVHPIRVAGLVNSITSQTVPLRVALFHDIFEDTDIRDLSEGCDGDVEIVTLQVNALSHYESESIQEYYDKIGDGHEALIKMCDRYDNLTDVDKRKKPYKSLKKTIETTEIILSLAEKRWSSTWIYGRLFEFHQKNKEEYCVH